MTEAGPGPRLVSFVGTGNYQPVRYTLDGRIATQSPWVACALAQLSDPPPSEIRLIVTPESRPRVDTMASDLRAAGLPSPVAVDVPSTFDPAAQWRQFEVVKAALRTEAGTPVVLDITHGFRSQPFFAAAVVAFIRAVDPNPPPLRVLYGAFEARDEPTGIAPVWDLTAFIELLDWAREIMLFLRTGRALDIANRTDALHRAFRRDWIAAGNDPNTAPRLDQLAKALAAFGGDLETIRTGNLLLGTEGQAGSLARLLDGVETARDAATSCAPPLADVLNRIVGMAAPLRLEGKTLGGEEGHAALAALARLYHGMGRYAEAISIVREGWITLYGRTAAQAPGLRVFDDQERHRAEDRWREHQGRLADEVGGIRNDIDHAGFRSQPKPPGSLIDATDKLVREFAAGAPGTSAGRTEWTFANISNHPSSAWSEKQKKAALAYADRISDVDFPAVPPDLGKGRFNTLVTDTLAKVPKGTTHAMVQGEFTLTFALVKALQKRGIACFAAVGERDVEEVGGSVTLRRFEFVRFREFAR